MNFMLNVTIIDNPLPRVLKNPFMKPIRMVTKRIIIKAGATPIFFATAAQTAEINPRVEPTDKSKLPAMRVVNTPRDTIPSIDICRKMFIWLLKEKKARLEIDKKMKKTTKTRTTKTIVTMTLQLLRPKTHCSWQRTSPFARLSMKADGTISRSKQELRGIQTDSKQTPRRESTTWCTERRFSRRRQQQQQPRRKRRPRRRHCRA